MIPCVIYDSGQDKRTLQSKECWEFFVFLGLRRNVNELLFYCLFISGWRCDWTWAGKKPNNDACVWDSTGQRFRLFRNEKETGPSWVSQRLLGLQLAIGKTIVQKLTGASPVTIPEKQLRDTLPSSSLLVSKVTNGFQWAGALPQVLPWVRYLKRGAGRICRPLTSSTV